MHRPKARYLPTVLTACLNRSCLGVSKARDCGSNGSVTGLREFGLWPYLAFAVHHEIGPLIVERDESGYLDAFGERRLVRPSQVFDDLAAGIDGPVLGETLVRATRDGVGWSEQVHPHAELRDVGASWQFRLQEQRRAADVGNLHAVHL